MQRNRQLVNRYKEVNLGEASFPICFSHASGAFLFDCDGNKYLDFTSGYGVASSGWLQPDIVNAIHSQLQKSAYAPPWIPTEEAIELGELLISLTPPNLIKCARASGGADANEIISKAAFASRGKSGCISFSRSYHGGTHFALGISDKKSFRLPPIPSRANLHLVDPPNCYRCPFKKHPDTCNMECINTVECLLETHDDIGTIFIEPVLGSGGVIIPPKRYLKRLRELCNVYAVFLVFDEVLTGFGRVGAITASELFAIEPDAISFAKGISAGYAAIGAAVVNEELSIAIKANEDVSSTFAWTPLSCCVATANINLILNQNMVENSRREGLYLLNRIRDLFETHLPENLGDVRGLGMMIGVELVANKEAKQPDTKLIMKLILLFLKRGLMVCASWDFQVLIVMPPLSITREEIDAGLEKMEEVLVEFEKQKMKVASV